MSISIFTRTEIPADAGDTLKVGDMVVFDRIDIGIVSVYGGVGINGQWFLRTGEYHRASGSFFIAAVIRDQNVNLFFFDQKGDMFVRDFSCGLSNMDIDVSVTQPTSNTRHQLEMVFVGEHGRQAIAGAQVPQAIAAAKPQVPQSTLKRKTVGESTPVESTPENDRRLRTRITKVIAADVESESAGVSVEETKKPVAKKKVNNKVKNTGKNKAKASSRAVVVKPAPAQVSIPVKQIMIAAPRPVVVSSPTRRQNEELLQQVFSYKDFLQTQEETRRKDETKTNRLQQLVTVAPNITTDNLKLLVGFAAED